MPRITFLYSGTHTKLVYPINIFKVLKIDVQKFVHCRNYLISKPEMILNAVSLALSILGRSLYWDFFWTLKMLQMLT